VTEKNRTNKYIHGTTKEEQGRLKLLNSLTNASFINFLGAFLDEVPGYDLNNKKIADFGCGTGELVAEIAEKYPTAEITGIEISEAQFKTAVERNRENSNVTLINRDVLKSDLKDIAFDITFDIIYCRYLL
jgi:ubiquinone/menaquinone biosynthesis C-methylase UbiE